MARKYSPDEIIVIQDKIIKGLWQGKSLRQILMKKGMPSRRYVYEWLNPENDRFDAEFSNNYAHARRENADFYYDKICEITKKIENKEIRPDAGRVIIDALKWKAGRMKPTKYGDKLDITTNGNDVISQVVVFELPDNKRDKKTEK